MQNSDPTFIQRLSVIAITLFSQEQLKTDHEVIYSFCYYTEHDFQIHNSQTSKYIFIFNPRYSSMDLAIIFKSITLLLGLYMAWNIGANDVANAMGTSVGSKALTLKKAVGLAIIFEFCGAFFVGSSVSQTIQGGIINLNVFEATPHLFVIGMMGSLLATGILLQIASYFGLPVSTTHAIVGAILGFGAIVGGIDAIQWNAMGRISMSWVLSPILSGILSYTIFTLIQQKILLAYQPILAAKKLTPYFVFLCFNVVILSLFYRGLIEFDFHLSFNQALLISCPISLSFALMSRLWLERKMNVLIYTNTHLHGDIKDQPSLQSVEQIFAYLQIISACLVAFAHGANDVANAIGPVSAVLSALQTNTLQTHSTIPSWLLLLGSMGIVLGLATWGWRVIETIGQKITEFTPTRGFSAELGTAATILFASKLGLPVSTTHALVGAICGVGIAQGIQALNLQTLKEIIISWIVTIPLCAILSIFLFYLLKFIFL